MVSLSTYAPLIPAVNSQFYVPRAEQEAIVLAVLRGGNVLVLGPSGSGKTTTLRFVAEELRGQGAAVGFVDAGGGLAEPIEILQLVLYELSRELPSSARSRIEEALRSPFSPADPNVRVFELLRTLRDVLPTRKQLVAIIDGISGSAAQALFGRLRDELWQLSLRWIVSGDPRDRQGLLAPPADAFFDTVVMFEPFPDELRRDLLRRYGVKAADAVQLATTAEWPRDLLRVLAQAAQTPGGAAEMLSARAERINQASKLGRSAAMLLSELETAPASASDKRLLDRLGWSRSRVAQVLKKLEAAGLVVGYDEPSARGASRRVYRVKA